MALGTRREARERALALLYEAEMKGLSPAALLEELPVAPQPFARELVVGVGSSAPELDALLRRHSHDWPIERMATVDRLLLCIAVHELRARPEVPRAVIISEAVELAKRYSTEESGRFVNGILSAIAADVRG